MIQGEKRENGAVWSRSLIAQNERSLFARDAQHRGFPLDGEPFSEVSKTLRRSGETGRRTGLKIQRGRPHVGSIPTSGTTDSRRKALDIVY
jgi:hypothetical protein